MIVFCDGCNVAVHQLCYGILSIPAAEWLCETCKLNCKQTPKQQQTKRIAPVRVMLKPSRRKTDRKKDRNSADSFWSLQICELCGLTGGAMKRTTTKFDPNDREQRRHLGWAHMVCALWIPGVRLLNPQRMEPIDVSNIVNSPKLLNTLSDEVPAMCSVCERTDGRFIQCKEYKCRVLYHPYCAIRSKFLVDVKQKVFRHGHRIQAIWQSFCKPHSRQVRRKRKGKR
jgi:hypothetical protein